MNQHTSTPILSSIFQFFFFSFLRNKMSRLWLLKLDPWGGEEVENISFTNCPYRPLSFLQSFIKWCNWLLEHPTGPMWNKAAHTPVPMSIAGQQASVKTHVYPQSLSCSLEVNSIPVHKEPKQTQGQSWQEEDFLREDSKGYFQKRGDSLLLWQ